MITKKNNKVDLGIGNFVTRVQQNVRPVVENETPEVPPVVDTPVAGTPVPTPLPEKEEPVDEEPAAAMSGTGPESEPPRPKGRPRKSRGVVRRTQKLVRFDEKMCKEMGMIKVLHGIDMQDFIYIATERFRDEFFPGGKATKEGLVIIQEALSRINGEG